MKGSEALNLIEISDPEDPRILLYRDIRERDLVGRKSRFLAEGKVVLNILLTSSRFEAESIFLLENRLDGLAELLQRHAGELPILVARREIMDKVAGFPMHRGILAIGKRRSPVSLEGMLVSSPRVLVVLAGISNHDNVGSIFRNAAAFGADGVILDDKCCDPLYRKAIRVSVGAALKVPFVHSGKIEEICDRLCMAGFRILAFSPGATLDLRAVDSEPATALLFGSEGYGLPESLLQRFESARIAMVPEFDSLNVAAASAIALHHFIR